MLKLLIAMSQMDWLVACSSPGLRDRVKSSQDFTFGHPLPTGEGFLEFPATDLNG
jgi:hypothetical protein